MRFWLRCGWPPLVSPGQGLRFPLKRGSQRCGQQRLQPRDPPQPGAVWAGLCCPLPPSLRWAWERAASLWPLRCRSGTSSGVGEQLPRQLSRCDRPRRQPRNRRSRSHPTVQGARGPLVRFLPANTRGGSQSKLPGVPSSKDIDPWGGGQGHPHDSPPPVTSQRPNLMTPPHGGKGSLNSGNN